MAIGTVLAFVLTLLACVNGSTNSCQDIDHDACVAMAKQNSALCSDPTLASSACPSYCNNCPITCYKCNVSTSDVNSCNTLTCQNNMICMMEEVQSVRNGQHMYYLGCATKAKCDGERRRSLQSRDVTIHCCNSDLCNNPLPTTIRGGTTTPLSTTTASTSTTRVTAPPIPVCTRDILFMVDQSHSFAQTEYPGLRIGLAELVSVMNTGNRADGTEVALVTFDATWYPQLPFNSGYNKNALVKEFNSILPDVTSNYHSTPSWYTTAYFLSEWSERYVTGNRPLVPDVVVIITGRESSDNTVAELKTISAKLRATQSNVITIGIGQVQPYISLLATDDRHIIYLGHATDLKLYSMKLKILKLVCS